MASGLRLSVLACCLATSGAAMGAGLNSLTVCADPGNMPLSNRQGAGFENKIAQLIGAALGTGVQYYWRPSIERGLMRTTLSEGNCDLWLDMASDTEGAVVLAPPLYRSTFVLAYRDDKGIHITSLDDPALKKLRVGVFQVSAAREALAEHHVIDNTVIHYLSHDADIVADSQPSYQVQQVIDGSLDVAAVWGPMAGYYRTVMHAPLTILPINRLEDRVPLQFDMTLAVPRGRPDIKAAIETAVAQHKAEIQAILADFGVPLVRCDECTVSGDLPSHGPYRPIEPHVQTAAATPRQRAARMAELKKWLKEGANPDDELNNAIVADDLDRVRYLATHGANVNSQDGAGYTPLISATRSGFADVATFLAEHEADPNLTDSSGWTPLMWAAWGDDPALAKMLLSHGARLDSVDKDGLTPLGIAARSGKLEATVALLDAGAGVAAVDYAKISPLDLVKSTPQGKLVNPYKDTQEDIVASGQKGLLHYSCSGCHGGGGGGGICPALTNDIWVYGGDDDTLFRLVTLGSDELQKAGYARKGRENVVAPMPPFGAIIPNADDLWKIIAFIRSRYSGDPAYKFGTPAPET